MRHFVVALALWFGLTAARAADVTVNYQTSTGPQQVNANDPLPVTGGAPYSYTPLGPSQNNLAITSATALTIPAGATYATVCVEGTGARWTWDGTTTPTSSVGSVLVGSQCLAFAGALILANLKFIQTSATATLDVEYAK